MPAPDISTALVSANFVAGIYKAAGVTKAISDFLTSYSAPTANGLEVLDANGNRPWAAGDLLSALADADNTVYVEWYQLTLADPMSGENDPLGFVGSESVPVFCYVYDGQLGWTAASGEYENAGAVTEDAVNRVAASYVTGGITTSVNGATANNDAASSIDPITQVGVGFFSSDGVSAEYPINGYIRRIIVFPLITDTADLEALADTGPTGDEGPGEATATLSKTLDNATAAGSVAVSIAATAGITLGALTAASTATVTEIATASLTAGPATLSSTATAAEIATFAQTVGPATLSSAATLNPFVEADLAVTLDDADLEATAASQGSASADLTTDNATLSATVTAAITGSLQETLTDVSLTSVTVVLIDGTVSVSLGAAALEAVGLRERFASASITVEPATMAATAWIPDAVAPALAGLTITTTRRTGRTITAYPISGRTV